jgi:hypothetical protein
LFGGASCRFGFGIALIASLITVAGCAGSITPPADPEGPVSMFVLDYGRHSSVALPGPGSSGLVEYAYGDWNWFALDKSAWYDVFPTLFWPTQGALGRRALHAEASADGLLRFVGCEAVHEVPVGGDGAGELAAELGEHFERERDTLHYQSLYDLEFVHAQRSFHLFHTCNDAVVDWLRRVGCRVRGPVLSNDFIVRPVPGRTAGRDAEGKDA